MQPTTKDKDDDDDDDETTDDLAELRVLTWSIEGGSSLEDIQGDLPFWDLLLLQEVGENLHSDGPSKMEAMRYQSAPQVGTEDRRVDNDRHRAIRLSHFVYASRSSDFRQRVSSSPSLHLGEYSGGSREPLDVSCMFATSANPRHLPSCFCGD